MKTKSPIKNYCFTVRATDYVTYQKKRISIVPITKEQLFEFLKMYASEFVYQLEITTVEGTGESNPHFQGRMRLQVKKRKSTLLNLFREFFHENIIDKRVSHDAIINLVSFSPEYHKAASEFYCLKDDHTSVEGTQVRYPEPEPEYDGSDLFFGDIVDKKYAWQLQIREICDSIIERTVPEKLNVLRNGWQRTIIVLQDLEGGKGKSTFAKTLVFENPKDTVYVPVVDSPGQIMGALAKHKDPLKRIFFDIPRDLPYMDVRKIFMLAEQVKLGMFTTSYYATLQTRLQAPPAVVIFTNREFSYGDIQKFAPLNRFEFYSIDPDDGCITPIVNFSYKVDPPCFDGIA